MKEAEVCVVGAGAGGAVAAWALVQRGVRVLLLESGPRYDPARYTTHEQDVDILSAPFRRFTREAEPSYRSGPGQELDPDFAQLASDSISMLAGPASGRRQAFQWWRALGVGGSTLHFSGEAQRFAPHAFRMRSRHGVAADWPLDYAELEPYYARIEELIGVAGQPGNPFKAPRGPFPQPAHPLSASSLHLQGAARRLGWQLLPNSLAALSRPRPGRAPCHYCNGCGLGCMARAKGSVDVAVIPAAEASGRLELVTGFRVQRLEHGPDGRITGVIGTDARGVEQRIRARAVVLAAGAVETPRILLNSAGGAHPHGVGNAHDQVGRYLTDTLFVALFALFDPGLESYAGHPNDARIWDFNGASEDAPLPNGILIGPHTGFFSRLRGYAWEIAPGFGVRHRQRMAEVFGGAVELYAQAEQLPRADNRVTLSGQRDAAGAPLAHVEMRLDRQDLEAMAFARARLLELAEAGEAAEIPGQWTAYDGSVSTHSLGSCRMGHRPESSVLDPWGAVHGHSNLVVADASALVTQSADSPSLTIEALALRAAEALHDRASRGEV